MSKCRDKKIARANAWNFEMAEKTRAAKKQAKSERDAAAKRTKRRQASLARAVAVTFVQPAPQPSVFAVEIAPVASLQTSLLSADAN